jgi:hypothetical protein
MMLSDWIVSIQDWTWRGSDLPPRVVTKRFASKAEAEAHKQKLRQRYPDADTVLICVSPAPARMSKRCR